MTTVWVALAVVVLVAVASMIVVGRRNRSSSARDAAEPGYGTTTNRLGLEPHSKRDNGMDGGSL